MKTRIAVVVVASLCLVSAPLAAAVLTVLPGGNSTSSELHRLDPESGGLVPVGDIGFAVGALAFADDGRLMGVDAIRDVVVAIDPATGHGTLVGALGVDINDTSFGLTFDRHGQLWLAAYAFGPGFGLYRVDAHSGAAVLVGPMDMSAVGGLAEVGTELLARGYELHRVDPGNGEHKPVGDDQPTIFSSRGMAADERGNLWSLVVCTACGAPSDVVSLVNLDPATGTMRSIATPELPSQARGLAISSSPYRFRDRIQLRPSAQK